MNKKNKPAHDASSTGHIDEGRNETTRTPYTDSISTQASDSTVRDSKKEGRK
ncbi:MAG: hypothetical protein ACM3TR_03820 [Caulobacteraceae bacterium]